MTDYSYDSIYELTQAVVNGNASEAYTYDKVGNRLSALNSSPWSYNNSNELTSTPSGTTFAYDANGNTTSETNSSGYATRTYTWDFENRVTRIAYMSGRVVNYEYDPFGRRILGGNPQKIFAYDGDNLIEDLNTSGSVAAEYTEGLGIDEPMEETASGTSDYYEADGLGSITALTKSDGSVAGTYTYDSFGNVTAMTGGLSNRLEYTAREFDPDSGIFFIPLPGLLYDRARYYDPLLGRFLSEDPLGYKAGSNFYRYVANGPVNLTDPTGLYTLSGFPPGQAAEMTIAIGQLAAKLRGRPCCIDPKVSQRIQDLLQPFNNGSGVTFVYERSLPAPGPGYITCAEVTVPGFFSNTVDVSEAALDGTCGCPLAGTILHEMTHLLWTNYWSSAAEPQAYGNAAACFGSGCSMPRGLGKP